MSLPILNTEGKERYNRASVNWGSVSVVPAELVERYRTLYQTRATHITAPTAGGASTRTTGLAHALKAKQILISNGYKPKEVALIFAAVVAEPQS